MKIDFYKFLQSSREIRLNYFNVLNALSDYIFPVIMSRTISQLENGMKCHIGNCEITKEGLFIPSNFYFLNKKKNFIPWKQGFFITEFNESISLGSKYGIERFQLNEIWNTFLFAKLLDYFAEK